MEVYYENLIGTWEREDTGAIYVFHPNNQATVYANESEMHMQYWIETKGRASSLRIASWCVPFVVMNPSAKTPFFVVMSRKGQITLRKVG